MKVVSKADLASSFHGLLSRPFLYDLNDTATGCEYLYAEDVRTKFSPKWINRKS